MGQNLPAGPKNASLHRNNFDSNPAQAHYLLGRTCHRAERFEHAIVAYRRALRAAPKAPEIRFHLARAVLASDRPQEALSAFQEAFSNDPEGKLDRRECFECFKKLPVKPLPVFWQAEIARFFERQDIDKSRYLPGGFPRSIQAYRQMAPGDRSMADLLKWDAVEAQRPGTFESMYLIWCRTPGAPH